MFEGSKESLVFYVTTRRWRWRSRLVNTLGFGEIFVQALIWVVLIVLTFGIATPFFAYYFLKLIINRTEIHEM